MFQVEKLKELAGKENVWEGELLSKHTTFRIGGAARCYITPQTITALVQTLSYIREEKEPYFLMGNGSNLLVNDEGFDGVVVATHRNRQEDSVTEDDALDAIHVIADEKQKKRLTDKLKCNQFLEEAAGKTLVYAGSGVMLSKLSAFAAKQSLAGFEFASGIPGTLGGAVTMNAGAYGGEIKDSILGAQILLSDGTVVFWNKEELELGYRTSRIQKEDCIVLSAVFAWEDGNKEEIQQKMQELNRSRREKQPLEYGSAGSTFKRPEGHFAGKLIQDAGLKGYRVGDVMVSDKHAGFVVNVGNGTCAQADEVISHVQKTVQEKFGVFLETEVKRI